MNIVKSFSFLIALLYCGIAFSAEENPNIIINIKEPIANTTYQGTASLRGWVVAPVALERLEAYIDGVYLFNLPMGGTRTDVAAAFPDYPDAINSGFSTAINYSDYPSGSHELTIVAYDVNGDWLIKTVNFQTTAFALPFVSYPENQISLNGEQVGFEVNDPTTFTVKGVNIQGDTYDLRFRWRNVAQSFVVENINQTSFNLNHILGNVVDATTNMPVNGANVSLFSVAADGSKTLVNQTTVAADGRYYFSGLQAGNYVLETAATNYTDNHDSVVIEDAGQMQRQIALSPVLSSDELWRIVLTWGEQPKDLDVHLFATEADSNIHVFWQQRDIPPYAQLAIDDINNYGPETITIKQPVSGSYSFSVFNYTNRLETDTSALANSQAVVSVYNHTGLVEQFKVPNQAGIYWRVFDIQGDALIPVNIIDYQNPESAECCLN